MEKTLNEKAISQKENVNKKKGLPKVATIVISAVAVLLVLTILSGVLFGALLGVAGIIVGASVLTTEKKHFMQREFKVPTPGTFEVTDIVELEFDGYGTVKIELYGKEAPKTVENFLSLVESGNLAKEILTISSYTNRYITIGKEHDHSNNDCVHESIKGEFYDNAFENRISHVEGVLTMNAGDGLYTSSTTDFKILTDDCSDDYDGKYAAFGKVIDGGLAKIQKMVKDYKEKASSSSSSSSSVDTGDFKVGSNKLTITHADIKKGTIDYTFIPTVSGKYTFKHTAYNRFESIMVVADNASDSTKSAEFGTENGALKDGVEFELEKGETYTITFKFAEYALATSYYVTLETDILFAGENTVEVTNEQIQKENITYYYTANMTGVHSFTDKDGDLEDLIEIFDGENSLGKNSAYLEEGKTYPVVILVETLLADDYDITVVEPTITLGENEIKASNKTTLETLYYYFVAPKDAKYLISSKEVDTCVWDNEGNLVEGGTYIELKKGEVCKIELQPNSEAGCVINVYDNCLAFGENSKVITKANIEEKSVEYTFEATTNGVFSFFAKYQKLNENGEWETTSDGKKINIVTKKIKLYDEDGNELDVNGAILTKGKSYTFVLQTENINENALATIKITKIAPKILSASVINDY